MTSTPPGPPQAGAGTAPSSHHDPSVVLHAAQLYYRDELTQDVVAVRLGVSRATVSRLLAEARRLGIVRIEVIPPQQGDDTDLGEQVARRLGLQRVWVARGTRGLSTGAALAPQLSGALTTANLRPGDVLLLAAGQTLHEAVHAQLPSMPGVLTVPAVGGMEEPDVWYQSNEIARQVAERVGGRLTLLNAPALPSARLHQRLLDEPSIRRVTELWGQARCAVVGIGAPPAVRGSIASSIPLDSAALRAAVGDLCLRFFDRAGAPVTFPGGENVFSADLELLRRIPITIAVAAGREKVEGILAAARAGYIDELVTDRQTAADLLGQAPRE